jgi:hypothetical protein
LELLRSLDQAFDLAIYHATDPFLCMSASLNWDRP